MTNAAYSCDCVYYCWEYIIEHPGFESKVSQFMNKSTLRFMFFFPFLTGAYSLPNSGRPISSGDAGSYPSGYVPISNAPSSVAPAAVVAKLQGSWPGGVPPNQDGGMYGNYDGYPASEQAGYPQNIYQQY